MPHPKYPSEEIVRRGEELYAQSVRDQVEPRHRGEFLALDIETGQYEIDRDKLAAIDRAKAKHPGAALYLLRVGYPTAVRIGRWRAPSWIQQHPQEMGKIPL